MQCWLYSIWLGQIVNEHVLRGRDCHVYSVNKPLAAPGKSEDTTQGSKIVQRRNS